MYCWQGYFDSVASDAGVEGVCYASRSAGRPVRILNARLLQNVDNDLELWQAGCGGGEDIVESKCDLP